MQLSPTTYLPYNSSTTTANQPEVRYTSSQIASFIACLGGTRFHVQWTLAAEMHISKTCAANQFALQIMLAVEHPRNFPSSEEPAKVMYGMLAQRCAICPDSETQTNGRLYRKILHQSRKTDGIETDLFLGVLYSNRSHASRYLSKTGYSTRRLFDASVSQAACE